VLAALRESAPGPHRTGKLEAEGAPGERVIVLEVEEDGGKED
jgi:hypothetical protein